MTERVVIPGSRDVRGVVDSPDAEASETAVSACVVACPPHPRMGGDRADSRLRAVADALVDRGVACLRFDYGPWDEGRGERRDARNALSWASERYERVGCFGYSFGGCVALLAAADLETIGAVSALAPASQLAADLDAVTALDRIRGPVQIVYGERDDTADWEPVVERARELGLDVTEFPADHHFVGQRSRIGETVSGFLGDALA